MIIPRAGKTYPLNLSDEVRWDESDASSIWEGIAGNIGFSSTYVSQVIQ